MVRLLLDRGADIEARDKVSEQGSCVFMGKIIVELVYCNVTPLMLLLFVC